MRFIKLISLSILLISLPSFAGNMFSFGLMDLYGFPTVTPTVTTESPLLISDIGRSQIYQVTSIKYLVKFAEAVQAHYSASETLLVLDWDNVISKQNGTNFPFREDSQTVDTFRQISSLGSPFLIITSRKPKKLKDAKKVSQKMIAALENNGCRPDDLIPGILDEREVFKMGPDFVSKNIVFSAVSKGESLLDLLENGLVREPKVIIMIDDKMRHLKAVAEAFSNRSESLILLEFPT